MVFLPWLTLGEQIEVGTIAPDSPAPDYQPTDQHYEDEEEPLPTLPPAPGSLDFKGPGLFGPETGLGRSENLLLVYLQSAEFRDTDRQTAAQQHTHD